LSMLDNQIVQLLQKIHQLHQSSDPSVLVQLDTELQSLRQQLDSIALQQNQLTLEKLKTDCDKLKRSIRTEIEKLNTQGKGNHAHGLEQLEQEVGLITKRIEQLDVKTKFDQDLLNRYQNILEDLKLTLKDEIAKAH